MSDDMEKEIEYACIHSRTERLLIRCPVCYKPIGERLGNQWWYKNNNNGKVSKVRTEQNQSSPIGSYKVHCPDQNCSGGHTFSWVNEVTSIE